VWGEGRHPRVDNQLAVGGLGVTKTRLRWFQSVNGAVGDGLRVHPGAELRADFKSIPQRCHLFEMTFEWELNEETIHLPLGCFQGGWVEGQHLPTSSRLGAWGQRTHSETP
jgi:hypothetical protein